MCSGCCPASQFLFLSHAKHASLRPRARGIHTLHVKHIRSLRQPAAGRALRATTAFADAFATVTGRATHTPVARRAVRTRTGRAATCNREQGEARGRAAQGEVVGTGTTAVNANVGQLRGRVSTSYAAAGRTVEVEDSIIILRGG